MQTETDEVADDATPLCPACFLSLDDDPDFCPGCNAPLGAFVGYCPYRRIWACAYLFRRGAERPNNRLMLWGMVLLMTYIGKDAVPALLFAWPPASFESITSAISMMAFGLAPLLVAVIGLTKTLANFRRIQVEQESTSNEDSEPEANS